MINDPLIIKAGAVVIGLIWGAMWRASSLFDEGKGWKAIRRDLLISLFIGGANATLTLVIADILGAGILATMGLGVIVGATGLRALPELKAILINSARRKLLGDDVAIVHQPNSEIDEAIKRMKDIP